MAWMIVDSSRMAALNGCDNVPGKVPVRDLQQTGKLVHEDKVDPCWIQGTCWNNVPKQNPGFD
jgi:hypothetical protein